jgi:L-ascorbate metabolism protein UlaG (beta-lactamase superfamily)
MKAKLLIVLLSLTFILIFPGLALAQFGSISGQVTDEVTGLPLPMVHVWAHDSIGHSWGDAWTDTAGLYLIENLEAGQFVVGVHKAGYEDEVYPELVTVEEGQNTPDIDFALTPIGGSEFGSISGRVTDEQTGQPIIMAKITIIGIYRVWHTDTAGYYFCDSLPPGAYLVKAHKEGYVPEIYPDSVIVMPGENTPGIDIALIPIGEHGSISGQVTDEETGLPIIMARLRAIGLDNWCYGEAWSDTGGHYAILSLCPGIYQVIASKEGYAPEAYPDSVIVLAGENTPDIDFALSPISEYGSISGRVTDEETGLPISMAHLTAIGLDNWCYAEAWSDTDGYYTIPHLCAGIYQVNAHAQWYVPETYPDSVTVIVGENTPDIDFALIPVGGETGSISGRVTDEVTGLPLPMAHVLAYDSTFCAGDAWTDTGGYYLIQNLSASQR